ncbi:unnamed protein product [Moneuplotes crassus]|uniref:Cyclic nucleotide-binding domain-containing protein n=1 Tax=Euplotes crassus TaxID=5936 RepID=A0AAD1UC69_EUPCR|nr:unnamed protein product [Moneuplotes crassus]
MNPHISRLTTEFLNDMITDYYDTSKTNFDSEPDGVYIIIKGTCKIVNRLDGFDSGELSENQNKACYKIFFSDCFGEFDTLKISDYTIYGDIYSNSDVHVLFIPKAVFQSIPFYELELICNKFQGRNEQVEKALSRRYKVDEEIFNTKLY